jgi:hypothetical protein
MDTTEVKKYEFILWHNCTAACRFCPLDKTGKWNFDEYQRTSAMAACNSYIESDKFVPGSDLMVIGGELFINGEIVYSLFNKIIQHMKSGRVRNFMFNSNLIYEDLQDLATVIEYFTDAGLLDRVSLTTSFDVHGRFTDETKELFLDNLGIVSYSFPKTTIGVNMILTKQFCESIIDGTFVVSKFMEQYKVRVNLIPYININNAMSADIDMLFKAMSIIQFDLAHMARPDRTYWSDMYKILTRTELPIVLEYNGSEYIDKSSPKMPCGHGDNFGNIVQYRCFLCELKKFIEAFN